MKTRQLTLIGTVLAVSALSLPFIINETAPKPEIPKTPNLELIDELVELGCTEPAINHIFRYSNLLDDSFDGTYYVDAIGYPDDLSQVEFDKCVSLILEIRTISNGVPELDPDPHPEPPPASTQCRPGLPTFTSDFYLDKELCKWKLIPEPIISEAIPYVWNAYLQKRQIDFSPKDGSYINTDEGYFPEKETKVCSPLILSDGTKQYISSTFIIEPFEIIDTVMSDTQPDDCHKIWKTDTLLVEPSPELGAWLEHYWEKENEN